MATTPVFLPGKSHGQRILVGYSPWGHRVGHDLASQQQQCARNKAVIPGKKICFLASRNRSGGRKFPGEM